MENKIEEPQLREYELKGDKILKNGHTMFLQDVVTDLKRLAFLEHERAKPTPSLPTDEEIDNEAKKYEVDDINDSISRMGGFIVGAKWLRTNFSSEKCGFTIDDMKKACAVGIDIANKEGENDFQPFEDLIKSISTNPPKQNG